MGVAAGCVVVGVAVVVAGVVVVGVTVVVATIAGVGATTPLKTVEIGWNWKLFPRLGVRNPPRWSAVAAALTVWNSTGVNAWLLIGRGVPSARPTARCSVSTEAICAATRARSERLSSANSRVAAR